MELGAAIGWRAWRVVEDDEEELRLASVLYEDVWPLDEPLVAACSSGHRAPEYECTCGVYATRERAGARPYRVGRDEPGTVARVLGLVALGGDVVEHEHGWRASHAYPLRLWAPAELAARLAPYGVDVVGVRKLAAWTSASSTRRTSASAGSPRSRASCSAARTPSVRAAASG